MISKIHFRSFVKGPVLFTLILFMLAGCANKPFQDELDEDTSQSDHSSETQDSNSSPDNTSASENVETGINPDPAPDPNLPPPPNPTINIGTISRLETIMTLGEGIVESWQQSPNGQYLAVTTNLHTTVLETATLTSLYTTPAMNSYTINNAGELISPNSREILLWDGKAEPSILDLTESELYPQNAIFVQGTAIIDESIIVVAYGLNPQTGTEIRVIDLDDQTIEAALSLPFEIDALAYDTSQKQLVIATDSTGAIEIWQHIGDSFELKSTFAAENTVGLTFSPMGNFLAIQSLSEFEIVNVDSGNIAWQSNGMVAGFSEDETSVLAFVSDTSYTIGDLNWVNYESRTTTPLPQRGKMGLLAADKQFYFVVSPENGAIERRSTEDNSLVASSVTYTWVNNSSISSDGRLIGLVGIHGRVEILDAESFEVMKTYIVESSDESELVGVDFSSDGQWLAVSELGGNVSILEIASGSIVQTFSLVDSSEGLSNYQQMRENAAEFGGYFSLPIRLPLEFYDDDQQLAVGTTSSIQLIDLQNGQVSLSRPTNYATTFTRYLRATFALSPDESQLAYTNTSNELTIIDLETGEERIYPTSLSAIGEIKYTPDGEFLVVLHGSDNLFELLLFDAETYSVQRTVSLSDEITDFVDLDISKDGSFILATLVARGDRVQVKAFATETLGEITTIPTETIMAYFDFNPTGEQLLLVSKVDGVVQFWQPAVGSGATVIIPTETESEEENNSIFANGLRSMILSRGKELDIDYSPDGETVAIATGGAVNVYRGSSATEPDFVFQSESSGDRYADVFLGNHFMAVNNSSSVHIVDLETGEIFRTIEGLSLNTYGIQPFLMSEDETLLLRVNSSSVDIWNIETGQLQQRIEMPKFISGAALSPDNKTLAVLESGIVSLWDLEEGVNYQTIATGDFSSGDYIFAVSFSHGGNLLATGYANKVVLQDAASLEIVQVVGAPEINELGRISLVHFSSDDMQLVVRLQNTSNNPSSGVARFDLASGDLSFVWETNDRFQEAALSDKNITTVAFNGQLHELQFEDGQDKRVFTDYSYQNSYNFSLDRYLRYSFAGNTIMHVLSTMEPLVELPHLEYINSRFSQDGSLFIGVLDNDVTIWRTSDWQVVQTFRATVETPLSITPAPDGKHLLITGFSNSSHTWLWNIEENQLVREFYIQDANGHFPGDSTVALFSRENGQLIVWNWETGEELSTMQFAPYNYNRRVSISEDKQTMAVYTDESVTFLNTETGNVLQTIETTNVIFPNNIRNRLAIHLANNDLQLIDHNSGDLVRELGPVQTETEISFSQDGQYIVAATGADEITIWNGDDGTIHEQISYRGEEIRIEQIHNDNNVLITRSLNGSLQAWDIKSGDLVSVFEMNANLETIAISSDATLLASLTDDGQGQIWDLENGDLLYEFEPAFKAMWYWFTPDSKILFGRAQTILNAAQIFIIEE